MSKISVIVPVYNVALYLPECIESIISQTYKDLEIILVDDGSTDNSGAICDAYQEKDARIVVLHKQNEGLSEARNNGMDMATGEYITFVDSDDYIHPKMYEFLARAIEDYGADVSSSSYVSFKDGEQPEESVAAANSYSFKRIENRQQYRDNFLDPNFTHYVWRSLYKKDFLKNLRFEKGKRLEDVMFCAKMSRVISKRVVITDKLYYYRIRKNSIMHVNPNIFLEHIEAMKYNINHFKSCEDRTFVQRYVEHVMSLILTKRVERPIAGEWNSFVNKESYREFCKLYDEYGSSQKSHALGRYAPWLYNMLKKPKVKSYLKKNC